MSHKIVFLDSDSFPEWITTEPDPSWSAAWTAYPQTCADQVVERLAGATIAITNKVPLSREALSQLPDLQMIAVSATGYNIIDADAAREAGVVVCNVQDYAETSLAEHTLALMFALSRDLKAYDRLVTQGAWQQSDQFCLYYQPIRDLSGQQLGIIGGGSLGRAVAKRAAALGMIVKFADRRGGSASNKPDYISFEACLQTSDVISLHCPLTAATKNLIDTAEFAQMHRQPILINTARGGVVNEQAAVVAVEQKQISALGFDVLSTEPPSDDNPLLAIADRANVIITPHTAWASTAAMNKVWSQTLENVNGFLKQEISRQVI